MAGDMGDGRWNRECSAGDGRWYQIDSMGLACVTK